MDHDYWGALYMALLILVMITPSNIDKLRRKMKSRKTLMPDRFFDRITEFRNDFA